jgi:hypothetical protein
MLRLAILVSAVVAITASAAFSQTPAPVANAASLADVLRPFLQDAATLAFTIVCGFVVKYVRDKWGIDLQAERRNTFQIATTNAAGLFKQDGDISRAVEYVRQAAPDAIEHFNIAESELPEKILAKVGILESAGGVMPVMPGAVETAVTHR